MFYLVVSWIQIFSPKYHKYHLNILKTLIKKRELVDAKKEKNINWGQESLVSAL